MSEQVHKTDSSGARSSPRRSTPCSARRHRAAFTGEYTDTKTIGVYRCRACGTELFRSDTKFDSHCGWPSFFSPLAGDTVEYIEDRSMGSVRTEVRCATCHSHLGHVFSGEGYATPTDQRYCINSIALTLEPPRRLREPTASTVRAGRDQLGGGAGGRCRTAPPRARAGGLGGAQVAHEVDDAVQLVGLEGEHPLVVAEREAGDGVGPHVGVLARHLAVLGQHARRSSSSRYHSYERTNG